MLSKKKEDTNSSNVTSSENASLVSRSFLPLSIVAAIVLLDQITKYWVKGLSSDITILSFFSISYVENTGAAFGIFPGARWIFVAIAAVVIVLFANNLFKPLKITTLPFLFIIAGAFGNLIDRTVLGHVIDFLSFSFWPTFNIADIFLVVGVVFLVLSSIFLPQKRKKE